VATVYGGQRDSAVSVEEGRKNALVIAAGPDMLEALRETLAYWETTGFAECDEGCGCVVEIVRAAIAKAEGPK